jgi:hypothetical protein
MTREFDSDSPGEWEDQHHDHDDKSDDSDVDEKPEDDDGAAWQTVIDLVRELRHATHGLDRVHDAAIELDDLVTLYAERRSGTDPASAIPVLAVTRTFIAALDDAGLTHDQLHRLEPSIDSLASELGTALADASIADPQPPMWLDVASPAHGQVNISGVLTAFSERHVTTADSATVVTANDCTLEAVDHYHIRRVSLDCRSLYDDETAMAAFVHAMLDPSHRNISRLLGRLSRLVDPAPDAETQHHHRLPARVTTCTERAAVVAMGPGSTAHTTTIYHVRETVVPLAELLLQYPGLIHDLANLRAGDTLGDLILVALGQVEDPILLRNAANLPAVGTSVSHSLGGTRVRLANAVMVGWGNTLITGSKVDRGRSRLTNLARFDRKVAETWSTVQKQSNPGPPDRAPRMRRYWELPPSSPPPSLPSPVHPKLYRDPEPDFRTDPYPHQPPRPGTGIGGPSIGF